MMKIRIKHDDSHAAHDFNMQGPVCTDGADQSQTLFLTEDEARYLCLELALQLKMIKDERIAAAETSEIPRQGTGAFPYPPLD